MTGLLVSVRDAEEARSALAGGADVIDIKEPTRGALGAADVEAWQAVRQVVPLHVPLSVALGELTDDATAERVVQVARVPSVRYAKIGLAGTHRWPNWVERWTDMCAMLPESTERVAVGYVDHHAAHAPHPLAVFEAAAAHRCRTLLLDTSGKHQGDLFAHLDDRQLRQIAQRCRDAGMALVLAGSLRLTTIPRARGFEPALVAVRGAACGGDRSGTVCEAFVKQLKRRIGADFSTNLISP